MKNLFFFSIIIIFNSNLYGQLTYELSVETVVPKPKELMELQNNRRYFPSGSFDNLLIFQLNIDSKNYNYLSSEAEQLIKYNEKTKRIVEVNNIKVPGKKVMYIKQAAELVLYHGFFTVPLKFENKIIDDLDRGEYLLEYQDIWVSCNDQAIKLKSFNEHFYDKDISYYIDNSGRYVTVNTYVDIYLRSSFADSIISIYDFNELVNNEPKNNEIICKECVNAQVNQNFLYYSKKFYYEEGSDSYDWKVYRAPNFDLNRSELLAEYMELLLISPDAKFALCQKYLYGKLTYAILNIETKKYDFILGRNYAEYQYFYSPGYRKFAFDTPNSIVYIDLPKSFSFNAINPELKRKYTTDEDDNIFWGKLNHPPIK